MIKWTAFQLQIISNVTGFGEDELLEMLTEEEKAMNSKEA